MMRSVALVLGVLISAGAAGVAPAMASGQSATAAPRQVGTVKAVTSHDLVLTTAGGQDFAVTVSPSAHVLLVPPGSRDLSSAKPGTLADIAAGDRAIVNGTAGDTGTSLNATRVIVMKSSAIAATRAAEQAEWTQGVGGIVRSVDPATGSITVASGLRTITVTTTPSTIVRRYAGTSVRFEDAVKSTMAAVQPGDQIRARGQRSLDGNTVTADEIVTGSFRNFSGLLTAVNPAAGTVTLKDLATKKTVTVTVTDASNLRRLPAGMGQMMAARGRSGAEGGAQGAGAHAGQGAGEHQQGAGGGQGAGAGRYGAGAAGAGRAGGAGSDLSRIMNRLPTETLAGLKPGDAVMIVASDGSSSGTPTAITLLAGVEQILAAHPSGETTLSPWSIGSEPAEGEMGGGGAEGGPGGSQR